MAHGWLAGTAAFDITPPLGVELTGYANRPGPASDIHDPLMARALALSDGERSAALVSLDLLGLDADLIRDVRREVELACGLPPASLLLNCSHTHAGPATQTLRGLGRRDEAYCHLVCRWTASAVTLARRRMQPAQLSFGRAPVTIGSNRRKRTGDGRTIIGENATGAYDPTVYVLRVDSAGGRPLAIWFSHATHPVILGSENTVVSAEFPGAAARDLGAACDGAVALFAQGCCGDVNPIERGSFEAIARTGSTLAETAVRAALDARALDPRLTVALTMLDLPLKLPAADEAAAELDAGRARLAEVEAQATELPEYRMTQPRAMVEWATDYLAAARHRAPTSAPFEVQVIQLGDAAIVATSGETFMAIGQAIQAASPLADTVVLGYSNGCLGYIPTASAFAEGGYEVDTAFKYYGTLMVTPVCERMIVAAAGAAIPAIDRRPPGSPFR